MLASLALLLPLALSAVSAPAKRWPSGYQGAVYSITNDLQNNQVFASYIMDDGSLKPASATSSNGTGILSHFAGGPLAPHGATLFSSGSIQTWANYLFVPNPGSDTIASFKIDPMDPTKLTLMQTMPTGYNIPVSIAVHPKGQQVCAVGGGAKNGIRCWAFIDGMLYWQSQNDRSLAQNISTPIYGPTNGTISQLAYNADGTQLVVAVKGFTPPAPTGFFTSYLVSDYQLAREGVKTSVPSPGGNPFSIAFDYRQSNAFVSADVSGGVDICTIDYTGAASCTARILNGTKADCWAVQSPSTGLWYIVDTAQALIFGVNVTISGAAATIQSNTTVAANSQLPTDPVLVTLQYGEAFYVVSDTNIASFTLNSTGVPTVVGTLDSLPTGLSGLANTSSIILQGLGAYVMPPISMGNMSSSM